MHWAELVELHHLLLMVAAFGAGFWVRGWRWRGWRARWARSRRADA